MNVRVANVFELRELRWAWWSVVTDNRRAPCWFAANLGLSDCDGRIEGCHVVSQQRIRENLRARLAGDPYLSEWVALATWDVRNGIAGCARHHGMFDGKGAKPLPIWREDLPEHVVEFCDDWGFDWVLDRFQPRGALA